MIRWLGLLYIGILLFSLAGCKSPIGMGMPSFGLPPQSEPDL